MSKGKVVSRWKLGWIVTAVVVLAGSNVVSWCSDYVDEKRREEELEASERERERADEEEQRRRAKFERECEDLVRTVAAGPSAPGGPTATLEDRLIARSLIPEDFGLEATDLPCASENTTRRHALWSAFAQAAIASINTEALAKITDELAQSIKAIGLGEQPSEKLKAEVEALAKGHIRAKDRTLMGTALTACKRTTEVTQSEPGTLCRALAARDQALEKAEVAALKRAEAAEEAKERATRACVNRCDRAYPNWGARWDACNDRCLGLDRPLFD